MKKLALYFFLAPSFSFSQVVQQWASTENAMGSGIIANDMALDDSGNVYIAATAADNVYLAQMMVTLKYGPGGNLLWSRYLDTASSDELASAISVDKKGNAYITGTFNDGKVSQTGATVKYNAAGVFQWSKTYGWRGIDNELDAHGNIYVVSYDQAIVIQKFNPAGTLLWTERDDTSLGTSVFYPVGIKLDKSKNIYIGGYRDLNNFNREYFLKKFDSTAVLRWDKRYDPTVGIDNPISMAIDDSANTYLTGTTDLTNGNNNHFATVKYDSAATKRWSKIYSTVKEYRPTVIADKYGSAYIAGYSDNGTSKDFALIKYNAGGTQAWVTRYDSAFSHTLAFTHLTLDKNQNIYMSCFKQSGTSGDCATAKFDNSGNEIWSIHYATSTLNLPSRVLCDSSGNVFVSVSNANSITTIEYSQLTGIREKEPYGPVSVYPNPFSTETTLFLKGIPISEGQSLEIYNVLGEEVRRVPVLSEETLIKRENLSFGIYFYMLSSENQVLATGKIVVK